jgi:hypothetical protein
MEHTPLHGNSAKPYENSTQDIFKNVTLWWYDEILSDCCFTLFYVLLFLRDVISLHMWNKPGSLKAH